MVHTGLLSQKVEQCRSMKEFFLVRGGQEGGGGGVGGVTTILTLNEGQCKIIKKNHYKKNSDDHQYKHV